MAYVRSDCLRVNDAGCPPQVRSSAVDSPSRVDGAVPKDEREPARLGSSSGERLGSLVSGGEWRSERLGSLVSGGEWRYEPFRSLLPRETAVPNRSEYASPQKSPDPSGSERLFPAEIGVSGR